ncbi:MAG: acetoacetate decarboxylase family protein [Dehalococcoidia bacterium]|nr:MAG: acetoacetate decarboxylase family protein [Dehalococcoidia bacterium]
MDTEQDFFDGIEFEDVEIGGASLRFPVRYYDHSILVAGFGAPTPTVQKELPSDKLKPVELAPGTAAVALIAWEYGRIDGLAPYNEFMVLVSAMYESADGPSGLHGYYALQALVTTEEALIRGLDVYGYRRLVAEIGFEDAGEMHCCQVRSEGKDIISLEVKKLPADPQSWDMYFFTEKDGRLLRSLIKGQGEQGISGDEGGASYTLGDHPIADELRSLDMGSTPALYRYTPRWQSLAFPPGERLEL